MGSQKQGLVPVLHLPDGRKLPLSFWHPASLAQDLPTDLKHLKTMFGEPAITVISEFTASNMQAAVSELFQRVFRSLDRLILP